MFWGWCSWRALWADKTSIILVYKRRLSLIRFFKAFYDTICISSVLVVQSTWIILLMRLPCHSLLFIHLHHIVQQITPWSQCYIISAPLLINLAKILPRNEDFKNIDIRVIIIIVKCAPALLSLRSNFSTQLLRTDSEKLSLVQWPIKCGQNYSKEWGFQKNYFRVIFIIIKCAPALLSLRSSFSTRRVFKSRFRKFSFIQIPSKGMTFNTCQTFSDISQMEIEKIRVIIIIINCAPALLSLRNSFSTGLLRTDSEKFPWSTLLIKGMTKYLISDFDKMFNLYFLTPFFVLRQNITEKFPWSNY